MISYESDGKQHTVTILDDTGNDAELEIHFEEGAPNLVIRQFLVESEAEVIVVTARQALCIKEVFEALLEVKDIPPNELN